MSQRELARRLGLSPSLISQLESGMTKPSVGTLYAIVTELDVSLDRIIRGEDFAIVEPPLAADEPSFSPVVHRTRRAAIELASGVRWEELTARSEDGVDFLEAVYEVGGSSTPDSSLMCHQGREYGYIISGELRVRIEEVEYSLGPGDSIAFDSERPHRLFNAGEIPVHAVWFVLGRNEDTRSSG
jgi:transcriptional regulator with XRE-family HTH domain